MGVLCEKRVGGIGKVVENESEGWREVEAAVKQDQ